jgi:hypothetical protein
LKPLKRAPVIKTSEIVYPTVRKKKFTPANSYVLSSLQSPSLLDISIDNKFKKLTPLALLPKRGLTRVKSRPECLLHEIQSSKANLKPREQSKTDKSKAYTQAHAKWSYL